MCQGWVKIHREILDSSVMLNPNVFMLWCYLLLRARHETGKFPFNGKDMILLPGQLISSHDSLRIGLNRSLSLKQVRTALNYLKETGRLAVQSTNKFSIITILNWEKYQGEGRQEGKPRADEGQAEGKPRATNKNDKELKNGKNEKNSLASEPLIQFGKFIRMASQEMSELVLKFGQPLLDQELPEADLWIEKANTPNARKYRKQEHNHYLFLRSTWLANKSLKNQGTYSTKSTGITNAERILQMGRELEEEDNATK